MYYHFKYTSGVNPYIAKTKEERDKVINRHRLNGENISQEDEQFYIIDDLHNLADREYIKVNLPTSQKDFESGNGEGVYIVVTPETKAAHDSDEAGTIYNGILDNVSIEYKNLLPGEVIPFELRGSNRPVALYDWLITYFKLNE